MMPNVLEVVRRYIRESAKPGETLIDATMGNGNDTLFLAQLTGETGRVIAYDVQAQAVEKTRQRLEEEGMLDRVELRLESHVEMGQLAGPVAAVMFNLGYLPGGDEALSTQAETTVQAIEAGLTLLRPGGMMTIVIYVGHQAGVVEKEAVEAYCEQLDLGQYFVLKYQYLNQKNQAPFVLVIEKR
ncbi:tRNA (mnm(5)s(2)U34)-methyltransferase [Brevibacillus dissolubilis]|uniref:tRNA (mnm(5)s(2)U34)-methyltransferase n=1 Tax=Brevibacillus dissolubilis TaxID=1844116 RepID=UPI00111715A9|nr:class I SAM-dependent methyltransferase [Brevibacillus dissolubilis]